MQLLIHVLTSKLKKGMDEQPNPIVYVDLITYPQLNLSAGLANLCL